jgi:hypothetical protein
MIEMRKPINGPRDIVKTVEFDVGKFPIRFPFEFYEQNGLPTHCAFCGDEYDKEDPDKVELFQVTAVMVLVDPTDGTVVPYPWMVLFCKHCVFAMFRQPADSGVSHMFQ